jgi:hypothetical protein
MLIVPEVISEILKEKGAPPNCPQIVGSAEWRAQYDLRRGVESSDDLKNVIDHGTHTVSNPDDKHPVCEHCHLLDTIIIPMLEYRKKIGLSD